MRVRVIEPPFRRSSLVPTIRAHRSSGSDERRIPGSTRRQTRLESRAVDVLEIAPGLWRWTGYHEEWRQDVGCVYVETEDGVVLVDPLVPPEDTARFWKALDRDVKRAGAPVHVLVTVFWHTRSAAAMVERYGARVWAPKAGKAAIARRAGRRLRPVRGRTTRCPAASGRSAPPGPPRSCTGSRSTPP